MDCLEFHCLLKLHYFVIIFDVSLGSLPSALGSLSTLSMLSFDRNWLSGMYSWAANAHVVSCTILLIVS